jgi:hypothetical protein
VLAAELEQAHIEDHLAHGQEPFGALHRASGRIVFLFEKKIKSCKPRRVIAGV